MVMGLVRLLVCVVVLLVCLVGGQQDVELQALFEATTGGQWFNNSGWLTGDPCTNAWYGVSCVAGSVVALDLTENNLVGTLPPLELPSLQSLLLGRNVGLSGALPDYSNLNLTEIYLNDTQLSGTFPDWFSNLAWLEILYLSNTSLGGDFPSSWCNFQTIKRLSLGNQPLTGELPDCIGSLGTLEWLEIFSTDLSGSIPNSITQLVKLTYLEMNYNNFSGTIPQDLGNMAALQRLTLYNNQLEGSLPDSIGDLPVILEIHLRNNYLTGALPTNLQNAQSLVSMGLESNYFSGTIPDWLSPETMTNLLAIDLRCNNFEDPLPAWLQTDPAKDSDFIVWFGCNNLTENTLPKWCLQQTRCGVNACDGSRCSQTVPDNPAPNLAVIISLSCFLGLLLLGNVFLMMYLVKRKCLQPEHSAEMRPILGIKKRGLVNLVEDDDDDD